MPPRLEEMGETVTIEEVHSEIVENIDFNYTPDDPLILRKALDICRHDLHMAQVRYQFIRPLHEAAPNFPHFMDNTKLLGWTSLRRNTKMKFPVISLKK